MASDMYRIPWGPMDYSGIADAIRGFRAERHADAADKRANDYLDMEREAVRARADRESAALARQKEQDDYNRRVKAFEAMPALYRAAHKSVGMANQNPYGVKFEESFEAPDQGKADDEVSRFLAGDTAQPERPAVERQLLPTEEGPEQTPEAEAARFASTDDLMDQATTGAPLDTMTMAAANAMWKPIRKLRATYQGQRFEVPEQSEKTPFGAEYDAIYQGLLEADPTANPHDAMKFVAAQYKADQTQENIARRTAANTAALIGARETSREDQQRFQAEQDAQYRRTFEQAMSLARAAAARSDPSGGASPATMAALADYAIKNPGDVGGLYREADRLNAPSPGKAITAVSGATKPTESQAKDARQAAIGLRALDDIARTGYTPTREDIQKWLNNSRMVHLADKEGVVGGLASLGQTVGAVPQSEVEGLSPEAAAYFGNVRRYMETIGRAQSGAAISPSEWTNFFNQYGPNSRGGLAAARQYLVDQSTVSGVAGRQLSSQPGSQSRGPAAEKKPDRVVGNRRFRWNGRAYVEVK